MSNYLDFFTEGFFNRNISYNNLDNQMKLIGKIPSPLDDDNLINVVKNIENETINGNIHLLYEKYREKYGNFIGRRFINYRFKSLEKTKKYLKYSILPKQYKKNIIYIPKKSKKMS